MTARKGASARVGSADRSAARNHTPSPSMVAPVRSTRFEREMTDLMKRADQERASQTRRSGLTVKGPAPYETLERSKEVKPR